MIGGHTSTDQGAGALVGEALPKGNAAQKMENPTFRKPAVMMQIKPRRQRTKSMPFDEPPATAGGSTGAPAPRRGTCGRRAGGPRGAGRGTTRLRDGAVEHQGRHPEGAIAASATRRRLGRSAMSAIGVSHRRQPPRARRRSASKARRSSTGALSQWLEPKWLH